MTNRSYDNDPDEIKLLIAFHGLIPVRNKKGELGIHIPSECIHFEMIDGKSSCKINDTKPKVCRDYFCEKVITKALQEATNGLRV